MIKDKIQNIVIECLKDIKQDEVDKNSILIGNEGILDSLDFVNLLVSIEEYICEEFEQEITIADERAFSRSKSPFKNINSLCEYIFELLEEK